MKADSLALLSFL